VFAEPDPDAGIQDKLLKAWDLLLVPAAQRFGFMHKYSVDEFSLDMGRAVDMWSEVAVLTATAAEAYKLLNKVKVRTPAFVLVLCYFGVVWDRWTVDSFVHSYCDWHFAFVLAFFVFVFVLSMKCL
jgi:hypothetical protein